MNSKKKRLHVARTIVELEYAAETLVVKVRKDTASENNNMTVVLRADPAREMAYAILNILEEAPIPENQLPLFQGNDELFPEMNKTDLSPIDVTEKNKDAFRLSLPKYKDSPQDDGC